MDIHETAFLQAYPDYKKTTLLDKLRATDFARLDANHEIYLDYTGGGLYGEPQLAKHMKLLGEAVYGNPHSDNPTSLRSTELVEKARADVLAFFNASPDEYVAIFTSNTSGALRLLGESYPFAQDGRFLQLADNHNSVNGIREFARKNGAAIRVIKSRREDLQAQTANVQAALADHDSAPHLFAYPAQSNFSGVQHSLEWIALAQAEGWDVVLDAAAFAPTNELDLGKIKPDFVPLSFYKMFGWPTGVGCLLARKEALKKLHRPWFSGGTIWALSVQGDWHTMAPEHEAFEDGTVDYLNLPAISIGLSYLKQASIETIHRRVMCLVGWTLERLQELSHSNGQPLIQVYGPKTTDHRGGTIAFNFCNPSGRIVDERIVGRRAKERNISLRTGCFCNPGSGEITFDLPADKLKKGKGDGSRQDFDHYLSFLGLESGGAIRISFGMVSNFKDVTSLLDFAESFKDIESTETDLPPRGHC